MRIGIDIRPLQLSSQTSGIGVYIRNLVSALSCLDRENKYFLLCMKNKKLPKLTICKEFNYEFIPIPWIYLLHLNILWDKLILGGIIDNYSLDLVHFTSPFELKIHFDLGRHNRRSVITIHDLTPLLFAGQIFVRKRKILKPLYSALLKDISLAGNIIAISDNTRKDLIEKIGIPPEKVTVIHQGKDDTFRVIEDSDFLSAVKLKYDLPDEFIFYVGGFSYHKNLFRLLESMDILKKEYLIEIPLVIGGKIDRFFFSELESHIEKMGLENLVRFPGFILGQDLPAVYNLASIFVFPSIYEGFGLPVLEAIACGTPVACSGTSSLPEVAGEAALFFNPENPSEIAGAIRQILENHKMRENLKQKGIQRATEFSWDWTAKKTLELYTKIGGIFH